MAGSLQRLQAGSYSNGLAHIGRQGVANQNFDMTGNSAAGHFTIDQESTEPYQRFEFTNLLTGQYWGGKEEVANAQHTMSEVGSNLDGSEPFSLTETNHDAFERQYHGNRNFGYDYSNRAGKQSYTLLESGNLAASGEFQVTVQGLETYHLKEQRNDASGYLVRETTPKEAALAFTRQSENLPGFPSGDFVSTGDIAHKLIGNTVHGNLDQVKDSVGRLGSVPRFIDPATTEHPGTANDANPGSADRLPVGAPFVAAFGTPGVIIPPDFSADTGPADETQFKKRSEIIDQSFVGPTVFDKLYEPRQEPSLREKLDKWAVNSWRW